MPGTRAGNPLN